MAKDRRRRWVALAAAVAFPLVASAVAAAAPAAAAPRKGTALPSESRLVQSGHAAFWLCPARTTELLVAVDTLVLHPGASLDLSFIVRNDGASPCDYTAPYAGEVPGPTSAHLAAGPCGSVGFEIEDRHHRNVWPGPQVVNCPALGSAQLAPGTTVSGSGSWSQTWPGSTRRVPTGTYDLVVEGGRFSFPLRVTPT